MFDFSRITDTVSDLLGGSFAGDMAQSNSFLEVLNSAGLDPSVLTGLNEGQIFDLLAEHGIDPAAFSPAEIGELFSNLGISEAVSNLDISAIWDGSASNE